MIGHALLATTPARAWTDAYPLGDGRLGAMCFGDPTCDRFQLNHDTMWSGNPDRELAGGTVTIDQARAALERARSAMRAGDHVTADHAVRELQQRYSQSYLPLAACVLSAAGDEPPARMWRQLDLAGGEHRLTAEWPGRQMRRRAFVSACDGALTIDSRWQGGTGRVTVQLASPLQELERTTTPDSIEVVLAAPLDVAPEHEDVSPPVRWADDPATVVRAVVVLQLDHDGEPHDGGTGAIGASQATVSLAVATTFRQLGLAPDRDLDAARDRARAVLAEARAEEVDARRCAHGAEHRRLYDRVELQLGSVEHPSPTDQPQPDDQAEPGDQAEPSPPPTGGPPTTEDQLATARAAGRNPVAADPSLVALAFHYGRYLLAASSRPGTLPANLQGIWNDQLRPPWSSNYTLNINLEMNYWGAEIADLAECHEPLFDLIEALAVRGREAAARLYGSRGWVAHHNADAWAHVSPVGLGQGNPAWAFWPMAGPWLIQHLSEHLAFGSDREAADRAWPLVLGAAAFCLDQLEEIEPGVRATLLSTSPESEFIVESGGTAAVGRASTMDLELVRAALELLVALATKLGRHHDLVTEARTALVALPRPRIAGDGSLTEWWDDHRAVDPHHRHLSPLFALAPGTRRLDADEVSAATVTLDRRGDEASGWSLVWKALLWARLGRGDRVQDVLGLLFRDANRATGEWSGGVYPNLLAAHPPFQIDANLGLVRAVAECLVQWHRDRVTLLPALPPAWPTGAVHGLVVPPGAALDITWDNGEVTHAHLDPRRSGDVVIEIDGVRSTVALRRGRAIVWTADSPRWRET
jgi:alpha-L-fucosidase 2